MLAFSRLTSVLFFLLSFTFLVSALPTSGNALASRDPTCSDKLLTAVVDLHTKVEADVKALVACTTAAEVSAKVNVIVGHVQTCAEAVLAIGAKIDIDARVKDEVAAKVAAVITLVVNGCLEVALKLGWLVVLAVFAQLDVCLKLLLVNLGVCVEGIVDLIAKIVVSTCADVLLSLNFKLCAGVLAIVGL